MKKFILFLTLPTRNALKALSYERSAMVVEKDEILGAAINFLKSNR